jgi:hypothetical protein
MMTGHASSTWMATFFFGISSIVELMMTIGFPLPLPILLFAPAYPQALSSYGAKGVSGLLRVLLKTFSTY